MADRSVDDEIEANHRGNQERTDVGETVPAASFGVVAGSLLRPAGENRIETEDVEAEREENDAAHRPGVSERLKRLIE